MSKGTRLGFALAPALCAAMIGCGGDRGDAQVAALEKLAHPASVTPAPDHSNKYLGDPKAIALGHQLYFDSDFSGPATLLDMLNRPMTTAGRAAAGVRPKIACATCHDLAHGGSDPTPDPPGHVVSIGAGAYDVNGQQTIGAAFDRLVYWDGRNDSLWAQIAAVEESPVSMNGSRLRVAWRIADAYRAAYTDLFGGDWPLPPELDSVAMQQARLAPDGTCKMVAGACPTDLCHVVMSDGNTVCLPRFPLEGRPGYVAPGAAPQCDWGTTDPLQPNGDAFDCMDLADQLAVDRIYVNFAKAIAAYEYTLIPKDGAFDQWMDSGMTGTQLSAAAARGAALFVGKAACNGCHQGPLFTDQKFHDIGVPQAGSTYVPTVDECPAGGWCDCVSDDTHAPTNCLPNGLRDGLRKLKVNKFRRDSRWSDDLDCQNHFSLHTDLNYAMEHPTECDGMDGFYAANLDDSQKGQWKTPSLRNVSQTAPYMHDGYFATLEDVVKHYNDAGMNTPGPKVGMVDQKFQQLNLTDGEVSDLVEFLKALDSPIDPAAAAMPTVPATSNF